MTQFTSVSWTDEPVSTEKLEQMASNTQWLYENKPLATIKNAGVTRTSGMKILAGGQTFAPSNTWATTVELYFGNYFSVGCSPVIIPAIYGYPQTATYIHPKGLGGTQLPDHRGFGVYVRSNERDWKNGVLHAPFAIQYIAVGF